MGSLFLDYRLMLLTISGSFASTFPAQAKPLLFLGNEVRLHIDLYSITLLIASQFVSASLLDSSPFASSAGLRFIINLQLSPSSISHCFFSSLIALDAAAATVGLLSSASLCKENQKSKLRPFRKEYKSIIIRRTIMLRECRYL